MLAPAEVGSTAISYSEQWENRLPPASPQRRHHPRRRQQPDSAWACSHSQSFRRPDPDPTAEQSLSSRLFPSFRQRPEKLRMHATLMRYAQSSIRFRCRHRRRRRSGRRSIRNRGRNLRLRRTRRCRGGGDSLRCCRQRPERRSHRLVVKRRTLHRSSARRGSSSWFRGCRCRRHRPTLAGQANQGNPHGQPTAQPANAPAAPHAHSSTRMCSVIIDDERIHVLFPPTRNSRGPAVKIH